MACFATTQTFLSLCLLSLLFGITGFTKETKISARGYCGDGILNGNEQCDGNDMNFTDCSVLHGGSGRLSCQDNCIYDISACQRSISEITLASEIDRRIGGRAEDCKCQCDRNACAGGCATAINMNGQATCEFNCDNDCVCLCEGKTSAHIEECKVHCACGIDHNGNPDCSCRLSECDLVTVISPNIGSLTTGDCSGPGPIPGPPVPISPISMPMFVPPPDPPPPIPHMPGFCGDGIINGNEQCDRSAIPTTHCSDIGGGIGLVKCLPNCNLDISDCIRATR